MCFQNDASLAFLQLCLCLCASSASVYNLHSRSHWLHRKDPEQPGASTPHGLLHVSPRHVGQCKFQRLTQEIRISIERPGVFSPSGFFVSPGAVADLPLFAVWGALSIWQEGQCPPDFHFITGRRRSCAGCVFSCCWAERDVPGERSRVLAAHAWRKN